MPSGVTPEERFQSTGNLISGSREPNRNGAPAVRAKLPPREIAIAQSLAF